MQVARGTMNDKLKIQGRVVSHHASVCAPCVLPYRQRTILFLALCLVSLLGCQKAAETILIGQPDGPYRLALSVAPPQPQAQEPVSLTYRITDVQSGKPVSDLQILHERALHTFIVSRDFRTFVHIHHEDFAPLTAQDLTAATFHYPYTFPSAGEYLIASEFTHKDRSWMKQFALTVSGSTSPSEVAIDLTRTKTFGQYQAVLTTSPDPPLAGYDTELVLRLTHQDGTPVTNLGMYLGTEVHMASWRTDAANFGHQHTYTPQMAAMMTAMRDHTSNPNHMAQMMVQLMREPQKQVYYGPDLPVHHFFPTAGTYKVFFECAPGGKPMVADFTVNVAEYSEGMDTTVRSIVAPSDQVPRSPQG
ncbi:MAG: hypothetical protein FJ147_26395 [Deltaproteobacteria bacterium]|nr:hypothetical protein [Deltaproteobacteria bacterium]